MTSQSSYPDGGLSDADQARIVVAAAWTDPKTGQVFVHRDLEEALPLWDREAHIAPISRTERFGDVESWVAYVQRYLTPASLLTWNSRGLLAILDYHVTLDMPGRCQWTAAQPFEPAPEWLAWMQLANGAALTQRQAIERLEDLAEDVTDPTAADLMQLLRALRANATAKAETEIRPDGTTSVSFSKDTSVSNRAGSAELPALISIAIPVLAGDETRWALKVRLRVSVDDNAHLTFRFSAQNAERVLAVVYAERVDAAAKLLGDGVKLLRAAG